MLLRFSVANFLSIREQVEISFIATPLKELHESLIPSRYATHGVLPVVAIYGANASGKSNLLLALSFVRSAVLNSFSRGDKDTNIPYRPFLLDEDSHNKPSTFILDFVMNDTRYQFGASMTDEKVVEEWLYAYPKRVQQVLYSRKANESEDFYFGRALSGSNRQIQSITRPNSLFISAATKSGHPLLSEISSFFKDNISLKLSPGTMSGDSLAEVLEEDKVLLVEAARYLSMADTGITDVKIENSPIPDSAKNDLGELFKVLSKISGDFKKEVPEISRKIQLGHSGEDDKVRYLDFENESLGTKYLFSLLPAMLKAIRDGKTLVLDEITTSLHTLLSRRLVSIFEDKKLNQHGAQLIFSTHDTNLLAPGILRRDEIWFAEKSRAGVTSVFPLSDVKTKNTDNIERGYLQGRFGAIPFLRDELA